MTTNQIVAVLKGEAHYWREAIANGIRPAEPNVAQIVEALEEAAKRLSREPAQPAETCCEWREDDDGNWETSCKGCWNFPASGPVDNGVKFCPLCGRAVKIMPYQDDDDVAAPAPEPPARDALAPSTKACLLCGTWHAASVPCEMAGEPAPAPPVDLTEARRLALAQMATAANARIDAAMAELDAAPAPPVDGTRAWLIEWRVVGTQHPNAEWWTGVRSRIRETRPSWTRDANEAIRFPTREAAQIERDLDPETFGPFTEPTEHEWVGMPGAPPDEPAEVREARERADKALCDAIREGTPDAAVAYAKARNSTTEYDRMQAQRVAMEAQNAGELFPQFVDMVLKLERQTYAYGKAREDSAAFASCNRARQSAEVELLKVRSELEAEIEMHNDTRLRAETAERERDTALARVAELEKLCNDMEAEMTDYAFKTAAATARVARLGEALRNVLDWYFDDNDAKDEQRIGAARAALAEAGEGT